jgi:hypothetical protein
MTVLLLIFAIVMLGALFGAWLASITPDDAELWS